MNQSSRTLVIVDYQNLRHQAEMLNISPEVLFQALWDKTRTLAGILDVRLFAPVLQTTLHWNQVNALALKYGFSIEACPFLREGTGRKDTVDSVIFRWLVSYSSLATTVVFVTGDGDFIIAATLLKMQGRAVEVWSFNVDSTSHVLFTTIETHILPFNETERGMKGTNLSNPYALAVEKVLGDEKILPSEVTLLEQLVRAGEFLVNQRKGVRELKTLKADVATMLSINEADSQLLLNTLEGLGLQSDSLQALKLALELRKGG